MNRRQKLVQQKFLNNEETVIKRLKGVYGQSLKDITGKVADLDKSIADLQKALADVDDDEIGDLAKAFLGRRANISPAEAKETLQSMIQSKVYQKRYQEALKGQIDGVMDKMHGKEYKVVSDYLKECYEDGFIGTMFDLQGQGIPLCFPLDQEAMVRAVQLDSKISQGLYSRLGEDVALLKKKITAQVSLGIATGKSFQQVAQGLAAYTNIGYNNAVRIARTEGHRIQVQGTMDACYKAKDKGADVVKQWDSTLDGATRESHAAVDGEIRELDKPFSNGLMFPGDPSGGAAEVVNCRCALLQRARWALDEAELETLQKRAEYFGLDKSETFEDYKKTYLKAAEQIKPVEDRPTFTPAKSIKEAEEVAKKWVDDSGFGAIGMSYNGVCLDVANEINQALSDVFGMFNIPKLGGIAAPAKNTKLGKMINAHAAYSPIRRSLLLDRNKTKKASTFLEGLLEDKKAITNLLNHPERYDFNKLGTRLRKIIEASAPTGRSIVPETIVESIYHELGHHLERSVPKDAWDIIKSGMGEYATKVSGYSVDSPSEYFAESFASYMKGENVIDPKLRAIFDGMRR